MLASSPPLAEVLKEINATLVDGRIQRPTTDKADSRFRFAWLKDTAQLSAALDYSGAFTKRAISRPARTPAILPAWVTGMGLSWPANRRL